jgi:hypothetical protein
MDLKSDADSPPDTSLTRRADGVVWERRWCLVAECGVLTVALTLFYFAQPLADDFARGYKGRVQGVVPATVHEYYTWTGRWAGSGFNYFLTSSFDLVWAYPLLLLITPALLAVSVYALLHAAGIGESVRQRLALTASSLALYWAGMPHPGESVYWLTGSGENLAGLALCLLLIAGLLRHRPRRNVTTWATGDGLCGLAVLATGFHELFALLLCILLAGGTLVLWLTKDPRRWLCACCLLAAFAGFLVVYAAPGNAVRRADFPLAADLSTTLRLTVTQGVSNAVPWVLDVRLLGATALVLLLAPAAITATPATRAVGGRETAIVAGTWLCAIAAAFAAASWAIGMEMPWRTLNGVYLIFLLGWFWLLVMLTRQLSRRDPPLLAATPLMRRIAVGLFVLSMLLTGNTWQGVRDLRRSAPEYRLTLRNRWQSLEVAAKRGEQDVLVEPLHVRPQSYITYFELRDDPAYWENWSVAHYFGLRTVALRPQRDDK